MPMTKLTGDNGSDISKETVDKLADLILSSRTRDYRFRKIDLHYDSEHRKNGEIQVFGRQIVRSKEGREDPWIEVKVEAMNIGSTVDEAMGRVSADLQQHGLLFGDAIFEEGFWSLVDGKSPEGLLTQLILRHPELMLRSGDFRY